MVKKAEMYIEVQKRKDQLLATKQKVDELSALTQAK